MVSKSGVELLIKYFESSIFMMMVSSTLSRADNSDIRSQYSSLWDLGASLIYVVSNLVAP